MIAVRYEGLFCFAQARGTLSKQRSRARRDPNWGPVGACYYNYVNRLADGLGVELEAN